MADMESAREARRRKILENRESRMNRLLGKSPDTQNDPQHKNEVPEDITESESFLLRSSKHDTSYKSAEVSTIHDLDITTNNQTPSAVSQRILSDSPMSPTLREENKNIQLKPVNQFQHHTTQHGESWVPDDKHQPVTAKPDLLGMLDVMRAGGCVIVAFLTCWSFSFGLGLLFLELAMLPFILLEGFLFHFQTTHMKDVRLPHKFSVMSSALMLCGIQPKAIGLYDKIMGYICAVAEDFALFLFTVIFFNTFIGVNS